MLMTVLSLAGKVSAGVTIHAARMGQHRNDRLERIRSAARRRILPGGIEGDQTDEQTKRCHSHTYAPPARSIAALTRLGVNGTLLRRAPVASKIALPIAAGVTVIAVSPAPVAGTPAGRHEDALDARLMPCRMPPSLWFRRSSGFRGRSTIQRYNEPRWMHHARFHVHFHFGDESLVAVSAFAIDAGKPPPTHPAGSRDLGTRGAICVVHFQGDVHVALQVAARRLPFSRKSVRETIFFRPRSHCRRRGKQMGISRMRSVRIHHADASLETAKSSAVNGARTRAAPRKSHAIAGIQAAPSRSVYKGPPTRVKDSPAARCVFRGSRHNGSAQAF
jgi:hypothetical protein